MDKCLLIYVHYYLYFISNTVFVQNTILNIKKLEPGDTGGSRLAENIWRNKWMS